MIGQGPKKIWYFVLASVLLWFSLLYLYYSGLKIDNNQVITLKDDHGNFVGTHESNSVRVNENSIKEIGHFVDSNPIEHFFVGGDWDKYLDDISKVKDDLKQDDQTHFTENATQSINKVFGIGNEQESDNVVGSKEHGVETSVDPAPIEEKIVEKVMKDDTEVESSSGSDSESCFGRYIYVYDLPCQFNEDLIRHCQLLSEWYNMCPFLSNFGLGPRLRNADKVLSNTAWFDTNQFTLEVIFHNRMKQYKCLTNDSSVASAIFVPYYAGLDVARYLWNSHTSIRDYYSLNLVKWLTERPEWTRMWGRDHFLVAGRITWDFRRLTDGDSDWGNKLMLLPESRNMTMLTIESSPWHRNDFAIPYPTYFHPSIDREVFQWQNRMRRTKRRYLFSFAGAPRPNISSSIRSQVIEQCLASRKKCKMLDCVPRSNRCNKPVHVMKSFENSIFCLQPPGDSYTRRSTFDSILAGCIPVFFHPGSAYVQYLWHFPKDYTKYSVFIPVEDVKNGNASIESVLSQIPKAKILAMRNEVIKLIPGIVYANPSSSLETLEDAFDITIDGVLERVEKIRKDIKEGKEVSDDQEEYTWKKNLFGTLQEHEWDPYFVRS